MSHVKPKLRFILALILTVSPNLAAAEQVYFSDGWSEHRFSLFSSNDFVLGGDILNVISKKTVSILWTRLPLSMWGGRQAKWDWAVELSVPPTDLTQKGGDDRNLSIYFLFLPDEAAQESINSGLTSLLGNPDVRVLMYLWGGGHSPGQVLPTPYLGSRGRNLILQAAGTGSASEQVDLEKDYRKAFASEPKNLVGIAVSSDSDDTGSEVAASVSYLYVE